MSTEDEDKEFAAGFNSETLGAASEDEKPQADAQQSDDESKPTDDEKDASSTDDDTQATDDAKREESAAEKAGGDDDETDYRDLFAKSESDRRAEIGRNRQLREELMWRIARLEAQLAEAPAKKPSAESFDDDQDDDEYEPYRADRDPPKTQSKPEPRQRATPAVQPAQSDEDQRAAKQAWDAHIGEITSKHADWQSVVKSPEFGAWSRQLPQWSRDRVEDILDNGTAGEIVSVLSDFKGSSRAHRAEQDRIDQERRRKAAAAAGSIRSSNAGAQSVAGGASSGAVNEAAEFEAGWKLSERLERSQK